MANIFGDVLPWFNPRRTKPAAAAETTPGGHEETRWVVVADHLNPGEATIIKSRLDSEDIPAIIQQEAVGSVLGLTVGPLGSAKVLVPEPLFERASAILAETFATGEDWETDDELADRHPE